MGICIYGSSDDLLEVRGDVDEEFSASQDDAQYVATSTGVVIKVTCDDDGTWVLRPIAGRVQIVPARGEAAGNDDDGCPGYSDKAVIDNGIDGSVAWVVVGDRYEAAR